ncbi:MAG: NifX-associated nitrogen fixation protein [Candidatus Thiodiazotropha sp. (ex Lucina aurantia)]|uniref:NifX-associated nitrogen fixation protein n=2 Tax=Candidatus Thiodiazotropha TaxID=1913444 RepID=A0A9E4TSK6_9GAMM|nr:NifX-associated nitrogen fixation protein [Candidatus Thiodiazotropha endolucinida]MBT3010173.1 NifX-associated nitrogen fixation protein [Candidatus Thiodiazotropha sp. (ex Lucina pensylvanica)]MBT3022010.1 NifX-associated nitrogen fixation protein [Candidatus Thiodiazotropha taylori]MBT3038175.1 NifX-associated nitrogen fixation protein [Candidatus Thiodiazotropha sp. (ex Codakia orbicularis)]MBV2103259.1 NifX-associated nitrogen fixation protein [Candidatus Thiodiazotropha sp. (ex Lucina 
MNEAALAISNEDPVLGTDFAKEMVRQMRAVDTYGTYDEWPVEKILDPFVLTKEKKQEIPVVGDPDEIVMSRVKAFYNALSAMIEKECGLMAVPMLNLTHEGFGRAIITVGKLVVMDRTLRDVHRFGFPTLSKMKDEADKLLSVALEIVGQYPKVAGM